MIILPGALMNRLMQERKTLNDLSMLDPLTGLYNRRGLQHKLDNMLAVDDSPAMCCFSILITSKPITIITVT